MKYWQLVLWLAAIAGCDALLPQRPNPEDCLTKPGYCESLDESFICDDIYHICRPRNPDCISLAECPAPTNVACSNKKCSPCSVDKDCTDWSSARKQVPALKYCINGICGSCRSNANCSQTNQPICDSINYQCRGCSNDEDCSTKNIKVPYCNQSTKTCYTCKANSDCTGNPSKPYCSQGSCVQCLTSPNCSVTPSTPYCNQGSCVECETSADCGSTSPICDEELFCRTCFSNDECSAKGLFTPICYTADMGENTGQCGK